MNLIAEFYCECGGKTLMKLPPPGMTVHCRQCGRRWKHEQRSDASGEWSRVVLDQPELPPGWSSIHQAPPNVFLLLLCPAQTINLDLVVMVGKFSAGYHDRWDDEGGDALLDGGYVPIAFRPLADLGLCARPKGKAKT